MLSPQNLSQRRRIGIIVDSYRDFVFPRNLIGQGEIAPAGQVGRIDDHPGLGIERAGTANADPVRRVLTTGVAAFAQTWSMALITVARPAAGPSFGNMGTRV